MDLEKVDGKIREVERKECNSSTVTSIPPDFYQDVEKYIKELEEEIKNINSPRSSEVLRSRGRDPPMLPGTFS